MRAHFTRVKHLPLTDTNHISNMQERSLKEHGRKVPWVLIIMANGFCFNVRGTKAEIKAELHDLEQERDQRRRDAQLAAEERDRADRIARTPLPETLPDPPLRGPSEDSHEAEGELQANQSEEDERA